MNAFIRSAVPGNSGDVKNGLWCNPEGSLAFYPLGCSVVVRNLTCEGGQQKFLTGHTYPIGCVCLSASGNYLATGETSSVGSKVQVIIWDARSLAAVGQYVLHHASVAAIAVSPDDRYAASAGGADDGTVLVWDIQAASPVCGKSRLDGVDSTWQDTRISSKGLMGGVGGISRHNGGTAWQHPVQVLLLHTCQHLLKFV